MFCEYYNYIVSLSCSGIYQTVMRIVDLSLTVILMVYLWHSLSKDVRHKTVLPLITFISIESYIAAIVAGGLLMLGAVHWMGHCASFCLAAGCPRSRAFQCAPWPIASAPADQLKKPTLRPAPGRLSIF